MQISRLCYFYSTGRARFVHGCQRHPLGLIADVLECKGFFPHSHRASSFPGSRTLAHCAVILADGDHADVPAGLVFLSTNCEASGVCMMMAARQNYGILVLTNLKGHPIVGNSVNADARRSDFR